MALSRALAWQQQGEEKCRWRAACTWPLVPAGVAAEADADALAVTGRNALASRGMHHVGGSRRGWRFRRAANLQTTLVYLRPSLPRPSSLPLPPPSPFHTHTHTNPIQSNPINAHRAW